MDKTNVYCRFCAVQKSASAIINLTSSTEMLETVKNWLSSLKINFVDFSDKTLPTSICWDCYENLYKFRNFLNKIKVSQEVLSSLFLNINQMFSNKIKIEECSGDKSFWYPQPCDVEPKLEMESDETNEDINNTKAIPDAKTWALYPYICLQCKSLCDTLIDLREHSKAFHGTSEGFQCADCDIVVLSLAGFINHVREHRPELIQFCPICDNKVEDDNHMSTHSDIFLDLLTTNNIKPENEDLSQIQIDGLEEHNGVEGNTWEVYPWICQFCSTMFQNQENLRIHLKDYHNSCFGFKCADCTTELESYTQFVEHAKIHRSNSFEKDITLHTDRQRDLTCDQCGKEFYNKSALSKHILIHQAVSKDCKLCKKTFLTVYSLKKHEKLHNPEKPFQCPDCNKKFQQKANLKVHMIIHTDERPFPCQYCNKTFRFKGGLKTHEYQHTREKPYPCTFCDMKFTNSSNCKKHIKRKHENTLAKNVSTS